MPGTIYDVTKMSGMQMQVNMNAAELERIMQANQANMKVRRAREKAPGAVEGRWFGVPFSRLQLRDERFIVAYDGSGNELGTIDLFPVKMLYVSQLVNNGEFGDYVFRIDDDGNLRLDNKIHPDFWAQLHLSRVKAYVDY